MVRLNACVLAALALAFALAPSMAVPGDGRVANEGLDELSGLAVSRRDSSILWGHNDTGSGPVLYRLDRTGADLGAVWVPDAAAADWEDIAAFTDASGPALLIADAGDNLGWRTVVSLYAVRDPGRTREPATLLWRLDFRFPDGPRDCEAVAVDEAAREILLVSKRERPPRLYRLPLPSRAPQGTLIAEAVGVLTGLPEPSLRERVTAPLAATFFHSPTALDISADGASAVVVTPRHAYRYRRAAGRTWREVLTRPAAGIVRLPDLPQIEAGALSADGRTLTVGSEGRPSRLARVELP